MRSLALVSILALTLAACGGGGGGGGLPATGTLKVMVTDDPFPFPADLVASATIRIVRVEARNADLGGWQVLFDADAVPEPDPEDPGAPPPEAPGPVEMDLVPLTGGISQLLVEIEVPVGTYDEVRLIVDAGEVVLQEAAWVESLEAYPASHTFDTENGKLRFPSGAQSGIKVKIENDIVVETQLSEDLTLEFDLATNFVFNGTPERAPGVKRINFTPVVRATNTSVNGSIALRAMSNDGDPDSAADDTPLPSSTVVVYSVDADDVETEVSTVTGGADGSFLIHLPPGTYNVDVLADGYDPTSLDGIPVTVNNLYDAGEVALQVAAFWLEGFVRTDGGTPGDDTDDEPLAGATVELWSASPSDAGAELVGSATTEAAGAYVFTGYAPGTYFLRFAAPDHDTLDVPGVAVEPGVPTPKDVTLVQTAP